MKSVTESNFPDNDDITFLSKDIFPFNGNIFHRAVKTQLIDIFQQLLGNCKLKHSWNDD